MKIKTFGLVALLAAGVLTLTWCNKTENSVETPVENPVENTEENVEIANPASVYCEENGGTLVLEEGAWLCMFPDGSYCEEWSYFRNECLPGDIMYNTINEEETVEPANTSFIYSEEDLAAAQAAIENVVNNEWQVAVEWFKATYAGDEASASEFEYCLNLNPEIAGCAVFTSSFHIPEQDVEMAGAFEPNTDINGWSWYLGKNAAGEWEVLSNGFG